MGRLFGCPSLWARQRPRLCACVASDLVRAPCARAREGRACAGLDFGIFKQLVLTVARAWTRVNTESKILCPMCESQGERTRERAPARRSARPSPKPKPSPKGEPRPRPRARAWRARETAATRRTRKRTLDFKTRTYHANGKNRKDLRLSSSDIFGGFPCVGVVVTWAAVGLAY